MATTSFADLASARKAAKEETSLIRGGGEMSERIRNYPWEETPLGSIAEWPPELLSFVNMILASREIMTLFWGADRIMIYNDQYISQLGPRHPALGQPLRAVWPDVVEQVSNFIDPAFEDGVAAYLDNAPLTVYENGVSSQRFYNASFEPIWVRNGKRMAVEGVHQIAINNTDTLLLQEERDKERTTLTLAQQVAEIACWQWSVPAGNIVWVGDTKPLFGVPPNALATAEQALSCVHPDDVEDVDAALKPVLEGRGELNLEHRVVHPDGSIRWLAIKGRPLFAESGEVQAVVGASTNVTTAREAQLAVLRATEQLTLAVEAVGLATWYYDPVHGVVGGDSKMASLFGVDETVGPAAVWIAKIHPEDRDRVAAEFAAALEGATYDTEYRVCHGDRTRWVRARADRSQENEAKLIGICEDVTERKQAEAELKSVSERLALASSTGFITSWDWDQTTNKLIWHGSEYTWGRPTTELDTPEKCFSYIHPEDAALVQEALQPAFDGSGEYLCEFRVRWPDGSVRWNTAGGQGLSPDASGRPTRLVGVNQNVTEQKKAEAALIQNEKLAAVGRLASSIAHEINNPLEAVTNLIFLARSSSQTSADTQDYLDLADRELRRASNIASQTLRFHKQSSGAVLCSGDELFREVLTVYQGRLANNHIQVEEQYSAKERMECFEGDIRQVLSNLIGNAIDSMPTGGRLLLRSRIATEQPTGRRGTILTVADTGTGMSVAVQKRIFDAFYSTKGIGGTGLGLWISKEIVERHHGSLRLRSSEKDKASGSVFTLFLPLVRGS